MASHSDVAHNWAHKTGLAQNGGNVWYQGSTIYSYGSHFPMARHVTVKKQDIVLITTKGYSVSTAKHIGHVWHACHHLNPIAVRNVTADNKAGHLANIQEGMDRAAQCMEKAKRARKYGDMHRAEATRILEHMERYAKLFLHVRYRRRDGRA